MIKSRVVTAAVLKILKKKYISAKKENNNNKTLTIQITQTIYLSLQILGKQNIK